MVASFSNMGIPIVEECESGSIRLIGGSTNSTGRVLVCANGVWGKVCNKLQYWTTANAKVVCRQLGFPVNSKRDNTLDIQRYWCSMV